MDVLCCCWPWWWQTMTAREKLAQAKQPTHTHKHSSTLNTKSTTNKIRNFNERTAPVKKKEVTQHKPKNYLCC